jgi:hypothetical protein
MRRSVAVAPQSKVGTGDRGAHSPEPRFQFLFNELNILTNNSNGLVLKIDVPVLIQLSGDNQRFDQ